MWYHVSEGLAVALSSLKLNKIRSTLAVLGIIIGVAAVIAMLSLGEGARSAVEAQIKAMGTNLLFVRSGPSRHRGVRLAAGEGVRLSNKDAELIAERCDAVVEVVPEFAGRLQVKHGNMNWNPYIIGTTPAYAGIRNARLSWGKYFTNDDVLSRQRVAVLGPVVAQELFGDRDPVGQQIKIRNINFVVTGVLAARGQAMWYNLDDIVIVPITTAQKRLFGRNHLTSINVKVASEELMDAASVQIERVLRRSHRIPLERGNDFNIRSQQDMLTTLGETSRTFSTLLAGIAVVSIIVGGIGIMNVMLASVAERTREIGTRRAVGARRRDILSQFLVESVVLAMSGGIFGILLGVLSAVVLSDAAGWNIEVSLEGALLGFSFSVGAGVVFGVYPGVKASRLNPIDALRYE